MKNRTGLNLGDVFCLSIIFHIPDSWLNLLNGYDVYFPCKPPVEDRRKIKIKTPQKNLKKLRVRFIVDNGMQWQWRVRITLSSGPVFNQSLNTRHRVINAG